MPLETATHIKDLVITNPASSDGLNQGDDHMRMIKSVLITDIGDAMTSKSVTVPDGSSGAPSIGYKADITAGFYRNATGQQTVVGSLLGTGTVDIGFIGLFAAASVPTGYLACDGQAVSRTTYAQLFAKIGTTWGVGDGSTTFNVPPLMDKFPRHRDGAGAAGAVGTLQTNQNAAHTHTVSVTVTGTTSTDPGHFHSAGIYDPGHSHTYQQVVANAYNYYSAGFQGNVPAAGTTGVATTGVRVNSSNGLDTTYTAGSHSHTVTSTGANTTASQGGTEARPESATLLFCIRAL